MLHKFNRGTENQSNASKTSAELRDAWLAEFKAPVIHVLLAETGQPLKASAKLVKSVRPGCDVMDVEVVVGDEDLDAILGPMMAGELRKMKGSETK